jgi:hypothetical protein
MDRRRQAQGSVSAASSGGGTGKSRYRDGACDFRTGDTVREVVRYRFARLERAVADTTAGYAAAAA